MKIIKKDVLRKVDFKCEWCKTRCYQIGGHDKNNNKPVCKPCTREAKKQAFLFELADTGHWKAV